MTKPILCLDFDGVIHSYASRWKGAGVIPDPPVPGAIAAIDGYAKEFDVSIFSSRSKSLRGRRAMKRWLRYWMACYIYDDALKHAPDDFPTDSGPDYLAYSVADDVLGLIKWPWFKPPALMTIDDRAMTFDGTWPEIDVIKSFKPWNKRP